ncbi:MAG: cyclic nucleotide-binding domain-containing protein [Caldilineaceae bacterium]|nr:cyclic nucleotide-binding domain-containing protein [Caldilineaceae bacterium]
MSHDLRNEGRSCCILPGMETSLDKFRAIAFLNGLDDATLLELAQGAVWREFASGAVLFLEGEAASAIYYLEFGWVKVMKSSTDGREQILRFLGPGETFNELGVFANKSNPATAMALETVGVWLIPREADSVQLEPFFFACLDSAVPRFSTLPNL